MTSFRIKEHIVKKWACDNCGNFIKKVLPTQCSKCKKLIE